MRDVRSQILNLMTLVVDDEGLTVKSWAVKWLKLYKSHLQHNTVEMYRIMIDAHIIPVLGDVKLKNLKTHHVQELINQKLADGNTRTAEKIKLTLGQIIKQAIINEYIYKDIMLGVKIPKKIKPQKRALTDEEIACIRSASLELKEKTFIQMLLCTGLRRGEILALSKNDIDLKEKTVNVNKAVFANKGAYELKNLPKTESGYREIPLPDDVFKILHNYMLESNNLLLFPASGGGIMSPSSFRRFWDRIIRCIEKESASSEHIKIFNIANDITPHAFRHTYATLLYYAGVDVKTSQYLLGHVSIQVTMDIYTHLSNKNVNSSAQKVSDYISGIKNEPNESEEYNTHSVKFQSK